MKYVYVIPFRIACYTHKIQNCPPKDIFKKFERKANNQSTLVLGKVGLIKISKFFWLKESNAVIDCELGLSECTINGTVNSELLVSLQHNGFQLHNNIALLLMSI